MASGAHGSAGSPRPYPAHPRVALSRWLSAGNYTHLKSISTSKGSGGGKWSGVFPLVPRGVLLSRSHSRGIIDNGNFIRWGRGSIWVTWGRVTGGPARKYQCLVASSARGVVNLFKPEQVWEKSTPGFIASLAKAADYSYLLPRTFSRHLHF